MRKDDAIESIIKSKKYAGICEDTVRRVYEEAVTRYSAKEAEKAARAKLHQITGAFMTPDEVKKAKACLGEFIKGDEDAFLRCLETHASTRERPCANKLYERVFSSVPKDGMTLDLACGLNPLTLGRMSLNVWACDISRDAVCIVNEWSKALGWNVEAATVDLITGSVPKGDVALFMKLLPIIERQKKGAAQSLLYGVKARYKVVTFPTRTLSGRSVGMGRHYGEWFEPMIEPMRKIDVFESDFELCYVLEDSNV